jgi:hypothetical protein
MVIAHNLLQERTRLLEEAHSRAARTLVLTVNIGYNVHWRKKTYTGVDKDWRKRAVFGLCRQLDNTNYDALLV